MGASFNKAKCGQDLRQSQARINIHRSKKLSGIAKKKDDICKHLESGNEVNAKIWCETLINEEGMVPVYDVVSTMCDQVNGRLTQIAKFGAPKDMNQTFATIIHSAPKLDIKELIDVRKQLSAILDDKFVRECDTNYDLINPVVAKNIDFKKSEDGEIVLRMVNLAKERNIQYVPSHESAQALGAYCLRKGIPPPAGIAGLDSAVPQYVPQPQFVDFNAMAGQQQPPAGFPPGGPPMQPPPGSGMPPPGMGMPPPGHMDGGMAPGMGGMPGYNPGAAAPSYPNMDMPPAQGFDGSAGGGPQDGYNPGGDPGAAGGGGDDFAARLANLKNL